MSNISKLIQELCPDGVEFKSLGEVAAYSNSKISSEDLEENKYIGVDSLLPNFSGYTASSAPVKSGSLNKFKSGDILLGNIRPYLKKMIISEFNGGASPDVLVISVNKEFHDALNSKYLYYVLSASDFVGFNTSNSRGGKMPRGDKKKILMYRIPVPPLVVQEEIVRILDRFTLLEAELEAELEARRKQYAFYRDSLLNFENRGGECSFQWKPLSEIATIGTGSRNTNQAVRGGMYPFYVRSQTPLAAESFDYDEQAIITAGDGVGVGKVFHYQDGKYALHQRAYRIVIHAPLVEPKFVFYYIQNNFKGYIEKTAVHASVTSLRKPMFEKYQIPIPAMAEQQRTIEMLDRFDALVNDISSGLPAEIAARRTQYEHYRDQLLTFKEREPAGS